MKRIPLFLSLLTAVFTVSCVHVTTGVEELAAEFENCIQFHDKAYMKSVDMNVPNNVNEDAAGKPNFTLAFVRGESNNNRNSVGYFDEKEWRSFKSEFEQVMAWTKRFSRNQYSSVPVDEISVSDFTTTDRSKQILQTSLQLNTFSSDSEIGFFHGGGTLRKTTFIMDLGCVPLPAESMERMTVFPSVSVQTKGTLSQKNDKYGNPIKGIYLTSDVMSFIRQAQRAATIVAAVNRLYSAFPVVGAISGFEPDDDAAVIQAARDDGVLPGMEFVVYARLKADGKDAVRVPLFNATVDELGKTGKSTLRIWRKNSSKTAKEIIKKVYTDFTAARLEYDFFGCCDGLPDWPEIIRRPSAVGD